MVVKFFDKFFLNFLKYFTLNHRIKQSEFFNFFANLIEAIY